MAVVIGVDPGARWTGVVLRAGDDCLWHRVVDRQDDPASYLPRVEQAIWAAIDAHGVHYPDVPSPLYAVEAVTDPVGYEHVRPGDLIRLGICTGWVWRVCVLAGGPDRVVLVPPGRHGKLPLRAYPERLVTRSEREHAVRVGGWGKPAGQTAVIRHARSAWDVAGKAVAQMRVQAALAGAAR